MKGGPYMWAENAIIEALEPDSHRFEVAWTDYNGAQIEHFLRGYGVRVWNREVSDDEGDEWFSFHVRESQATWATALLLTIGVTILVGEVEGVKPMAELPRTSWDSTAPAMGLFGLLVEGWTGKPEAKNTVKRRRWWQRGRR